MEKYRIGKFLLLETIVETDDGFQVFEEYWSDSFLDEECHHIILRLHSNIAILDQCCILGYISKDNFKKIRGGNYLSHNKCDYVFDAFISEGFEDIELSKRFSEYFENTMSHRLYDNDKDKIVFPESYTQKMCYQYEEISIHITFPFLEEHSPTIEEFRNLKLKEEIEKSLSGQIVQPKQKRKM